MARRRKTRSKKAPKAGKVLAPKASLGSKPPPFTRGGPVAPKP